MFSVATSSTTSRGTDSAGAAAMDLARAAAETEAGPARVGAHLGVTSEEERTVTHYFATLDSAYVGWRWAVTVTRVPRSRTVTVSEVVLLPGDGALVAPPWLPWSERLRPGDLGVGDLLPTPAGDERLVPSSYAPADEDEADVVLELGLGRARVLSTEGRRQAAGRWHAGDHGPDAPIARAAPARCGTCGFLVAVRGALHSGFGVCANEFAADDGRVVSVDHGCGAHSEAVPLPEVQVGGPVLDEFAFEPIEPEDADPGEPLGHS
jgi:hypothetical protein